MISIWGGGDIIKLFFGDRLTKWPIAKEKTIKTFVFWDAPQPINMNHNKYLSSCKNLSQKW